MRPLVAALALTVAGCQAQAFIASPSDYAAYRATRLGATVEDRLAAAQRYLDKHPDGRFAEEVHAFFDAAETAFYDESKSTKAGLRSYLALLPTGPHHELAGRRLDELDAAARASREEISRSRAEVEARVSGPAAAERARVREEIEAWLQRFLDVKTYEAPLAAARADLVVPFALSLPSPRCTTFDPPEPQAVPRPAVARRCTKLFSLPYSVEVNRATEPREATLEVVLTQDARGVPLGATIAGPDLFLRLEETFRIRPIAPGDTAQRAAAVSRATALVKLAFGAAVSEDPACKRRPSPPAVLELACSGVAVTVTAAAAPGEDDRIVVRPLR
ncbi:Hypothetical protein A7982_03486 [Minicystis rosea]|nr:Hypothetical protein A7982_03486 [Minicystis rosea]